MIHGYSIINLKILLTIFVLFFSSLLFADDILDFQIEGISIGDSLLDHYSQIEINNGIPGGDYTDDYFINIGLPPKNQDFDDLSFFYKKMMMITLYISYLEIKNSLMILKAALHLCMKLKVLLKMLVNTKKEEYEFLYKNLADGKSVAYISEYPLENGQIRVYCQDWSEETKKQYLWK